MNHFKGKQFKKDVIIVAVGYYLRYNLSYREVQELLYDRGTIYRWVQEYSKVLYDLWKKKNRQWAEKEQLENVLLLKNKTLIEKRKSFDLRFLF